MNRQYNYNYDVRGDTWTRLASLDTPTFGVTINPPALCVVDDNMLFGFLFIDEGGCHRFQFYDKRANRWGIDLDVPVSDACSDGDVHCWRP